MRQLPDWETDTSDIEENEIFMCRGIKWMKMADSRIVRVFDIDDCDHSAINNGVTYH